MTLIKDITLMRDEKTKGKRTTESHLRDYAHVVIRRKWLVLLACLAFVVASIGYIKKTSPVYESRVLLMRETASETLPASVIGLPVTPRAWEASQELLVKSVSSLLEIKQQLLEKYKFQVTVEQLEGKISLSPYEKSSSVLNLRATANTPEQAQALANVGADIYIKKVTEMKRTELKQGLEFIKQQMEQLEEKAQGTEQALSDFRDREGLIFTTSGTASAGLIERLGNMQSELLKTENDIELVKSQLQSIEELISEKKKHAQSSSVTELSPQIDQLQERLIGLQLELHTKLETLTEKDQEVIAVQKKIDVMQKQLKTEFDRLLKGPGVTSFDPISELQSLMQQFITLNVQSKGLERKAALVTERIDRFKGEHPELVSKQIELNRLERRARVYEQTYATLMSKYEDMRLIEQMKTSGLKIIDPAPLPKSPIRPNKRWTLIFGGILGLFLGIAFAFLLEYLENTIRTPDDVAQHLELPVLGIVPQFAAARGAKTPPVIMQGDPKSAPAEAYRSLRTNLLSSGLGNPLKAIAVVSAGPSEGKTITVINLGMALAQAGQNVLLVDADLRRPALHRVFHTDRHRGLSTVLAGESTIDQAVVKTDVPHLSVLASGELPANPSEMLGSVEMKDLISHVREQYDMVLFDSAPVLGMTDGVVLASETDGTVLVIQTGEATRKALKMTVAQLEQVGAQVYGVVLNNVDVRRDRYYDYYYYYYYSPYEDDEGGKVRKRKKRH